MCLSTLNRHRLLSASLLGLLGVLVITRSEAADSVEPAKVTIASFQVSGSVDATLAANIERPALPPQSPQTGARPLDWRAMLPAVSLRGRY